MNCQSCGMPMTQDSDHGGNRSDNVYCQHCTDETGNLKSREDVKEGMILFYMQTMGKTREEAESAVGAHMAQMPAWAADRSAFVNDQPGLASNEPALSADRPALAKEEPALENNQPSMPSQPGPEPIPAQEPPVISQLEPAPESAAVEQPAENDLAQRNVTGVPPVPETPAAISQPTEE